VNENGGPFKGMKRFDARNAILEALTEKGILFFNFAVLALRFLIVGLYQDMANNEMVLPICSRTKDVIEPRMKPQW